MTHRRLPSGRWSRPAAVAGAVGLLGHESRGPAGGVGGSEEWKGNMRCGQGSNRVQIHVFTTFV